LADRIKGITVEIGGDTQGLSKALKDVNDTTFSLQRELKDVQRLLKFDPTNTELLAQQQQLLGDQVQSTEEKLRRLRIAEAQVQAQFERGDIGADQYRAFQRELQSTEGYLMNLRRRIDAVDDSNAPEQAANDVEKIGREAGKTTEALKRMGGAMGAAGRGLAAGAAAGAAGIGGLVIGTQDLNKDLAKLRFNAINEGFDVSKVEEGFKRIAAVSQETDSAVETLGQLMQTGFDDQQLSQAIDHVNGAAIKFADTLNTEGIADGIQETFATGKAVGMFGELLDRSGVNLDNFNAGLATATANGTQTDYVLQTMADLGLSSAADGFNKMNAELVAQQEAQINLQMALAQLGILLTPLATIVTNLLTKIAEWSIENINLVSSFDSIAAGIVALLPTLFGKGLEMITTIVNAIVQNLPMIISTGTQILLQLITGIIQMLPALIAQIQTMMPLVMSILQQNLPLIISAGVQLIVALVNGIIEMLPMLIDMALNLIVLLSTELLKHLPTIIEAGVKLIIALVKGLIKALPDIDRALTTIINAIIDALKGTDKKLAEMGKNIIQGLIDGITKKAGDVARAAGNIANGIAKKIGGILKLGSPSKVLISMGEDTGKGMEIGLQRSIGSISQAAASMGASITDSLTAFLGGGDAVSKYFEAIREDGDWLNDWLTHMPKDVANLAKQIGFVIAPQLEGSKSGNGSSVMNVNINSPKALNAREANVVWNRTMKKMQLQW
jgi:phage-related minor tail protein